MRCWYTSLMIFLKSCGSSLPVGREKDLNPLGHSGHLKLHAVVGSIAMLMGRPEMLDFPARLDRWKLLQIFQALDILFGVSFEAREKLS